jgi:N-acetylmuramic acid 6-phosphate etherase
MLQRLTGRNREDVRVALRKADGSVKLAVLLLQGCNPDEATTILDRAGGRLRTALAAIGRENALKNAPEIDSPPMHDSLIDD